jgi:hypothetical protein
MSVTSLHHTLYSNIVFIKLCKLLLENALAKNNYN